MKAIEITRNALREIGRFDLAEMVGESDIPCYVGIDYGLSREDYMTVDKAVILAMEATGIRLRRCTECDWNSYRSEGLLDLACEHVEPAYRPRVSPNPTTPTSNEETQ